MFVRRKARPDRPGRPSRPDRYVHQHYTPRCATGQMGLPEAGRRCPFNRTLLQTARTASL